MHKSDTFFKNGIKYANRQLLIKGIVNALIKQKLQASKITEEQIIEIYEGTLEMQEINETVRFLYSFISMQLGKKTTVKDIINSILKSKDIGAEFHQERTKIVETIVKINEVRINSMIILPLISSFLMKRLA